MSEFIIEKRDGSTEVFDIKKIRNAIHRSFQATESSFSNEEIDAISRAIFQKITSPTIHVEAVQDLVEKELMLEHPEVAKSYILYRDWRTTEREKRTNLKQAMDGIVAVEANDVNNENANMSAYTPAGQMMTFASEVTKDYTYKYLLHPEFAAKHREGLIHIHDLDYYPTKTTTCLQYDLEDLFERGFTTKNGSIRTPQSIQSYATLATIIFQTNQNEQHGGQAIPAFDFFLAPGVLKTYRKKVIDFISFFADLQDVALDTTWLKEQMATLISSILPTEQTIATFIAAFEDKITLTAEDVTTIFAKALQRTTKETHQAMEGFLHNLNTMHSRGGNQVVFSSINYGTDTSPEGRLVIKALLEETIKGLGRGETPVFPIQIFKVKDGISYSEADYKLAALDFDAAINGEVAFEAPNFDLLLEAVRTTATALFPNFVFLDTPFNQNELWQPNDPKRYLYEIATMGCRTRVFDNLNGEKSSVGRGNLSFTTMNFPRIAIEAKRQALTELPAAEKAEVQARASEIFIAEVSKLTGEVAEQLLVRLDYQKTALAKQFPFMMQNNVWKGGDTLGQNDPVGDVLNQGTLCIGFIGGHNAMVAIYGEGHAINDDAYNTLIDAVEAMNVVVDAYKAKHQLNFSVLATPAEGLSGRFTRLDRAKYGEISGVTDRDYYVNSFHVDVKEPISSFEKIQREAPFHALTLGGHITYVELDSEAKKNLSAVLKLVKTMHDEKIGYGSINHPVDTCRDCGYKGVIYTTCPLCKSENITRMRRITGYLTGSLETWNSAKRAEEKDRVKHGVGASAE